MKKVKEKPKYNMWQNTGFVLENAKRMYPSIIAVYLALVLLEVTAHVVELYLAPVILKKIEMESAVTELILTIVLFSSGMVLLRGLIIYLANSTMPGRTTTRLAIVNAIKQKMATTSLPNTENEKVQGLVEKAYTATDGNDRAPFERLWDTLRKLLVNVLGFVIYLSLLTSVDPLLTVITIITTVIGYYTSKRIHEWSYRHREEEQELQKRLHYTREKVDDLAFAKDIRIFGMKPWMEEVYACGMRAYRNFIGRREMVHIWADILEAVLAFLRNGVAYGYLIIKVLEQGLPASQFLLLFTAVGGFATWVRGILQELIDLHKISLDIQQVRDLLEYPEPFLYEEGKPISKEELSECEIRLEHVSYRYPGAKSDVIHDMNLTIHPGEKLAIVGLNGAGKTTLVKLVCGFYDPTEGRVLLNGEDIRQYNRRDYYALFSAVFQKFSVIQTSILENVTQSMEKANRERVMESLRKAGLSEKIESMPDGVETHIGHSIYDDGVELSGGEMQRLMLARALYKDGAMIVLDEPTAALDPIAENDIYTKYGELTQGRTSIFISHRLASTRFCDRILYLEHGRIAEEGTHESLLEKKGLYAELFAIQSKYYQEGGEEA